MGAGPHGRPARGLPASSCHKILTRAGVPRLAHLDRATGRVVRRYEHPAPGDLVHVDVKETRLDDRSRLAYTEILTDKRTQTAVGFSLRAQA